MDVHDILFKSFSPGTRAGSFSRGGGAARIIKLSVITRNMQADFPRTIKPK